MSISQGFIEELKSRLTLSRIVGRRISWDQKKTKASKGDYWAACPFHNEKTASFHVDDHKGLYYCFGCHQSGNTIQFVRKTENVNFIEAIEILAREASMSMPTSNPQAQKKYNRQEFLFKIMEQAVKFYRQEMNTPAGLAARNYLNKRGVNTDSLSHFEIGFAPYQHRVLYQHLIAKKYKPKDIIECGLAVKYDDTRIPHDRFINRIIFPIRNARGLCSGFGGRALNPKTPAKYLNSPQSILFDKGNSLYNHKHARRAANQFNSLIVTEGYMDVIALKQAGFPQVVAPLGTAITPGQLSLLWKIHPEPIIMLDGDNAGLRAAMRLIDLALPLLHVEKSLRFCLLPQGKDPDDIMQESGAQGFKSLLNKTEPMVNLLWRREIQKQTFDSPERRAAFDFRLNKAIKIIQDDTIRYHYKQAIKALQKATFHFDFKKSKILSVTNEIKTSLRATTERADNIIRESIILIAALRNPKAAARFENMLEKYSTDLKKHQDIQIAILNNLHDALRNKNPSDALIKTITHDLGYNPLDYLFRSTSLHQHPYLASNDVADQIEYTLFEELHKHLALTEVILETEKAKQDLLANVAGEYITNRLRTAINIKDQAMRAITTLNEHYEMNVKAHEKSDNLQKMLDNKIWIKKVK